MENETVWAEKYRPKSISECILPEELSKVFHKFVENKSSPNLILYGSSGIGKSTVARAMLDEIDADYMVINASLNRNIDTIRSDVLDFASSMSLKNNNRKYILFEEADYLNQASSQPSLRQLIDDYSEHTGFIFTCNYVTKLIPALRSRCSNIDFNLTASSFNDILKEYAKRTAKILNSEGVTYDTKLLMGTVKKYFPDFRRILNEVQFYSSSGILDESILAASNSDIIIDEFVNLYKKKNFQPLRDWAAKNSSIEPSEFSQKLYESNVKKDTIPQLVLCIKDYLYKDNFVTLKEVNLVAFIVEMLSSGVEFQ